MRCHVLCTFLLVAAAACQQQEQSHSSTTAATTATSEDTGDVIATYAGKKLTSGRVEKEMERLPAPSRTYLQAPDRKRQFIDNIILNDLLYGEGQRVGYDKDPDIDQQVNDLRRRLVVQKVVREYQKAPDITDEQAKAYYDANPNLYSTTQIRASHILVKDEATAKEILEQVKADPSKFAD